MEAACQAHRHGSDVVRDARQDAWAAGPLALPALGHPDEAAGRSACRAQAWLREEAHPCPCQQLDGALLEAAAEQCRRDAVRSAERSDDAVARQWADRD